MIRRLWLPAAVTAVAIPFAGRSVPTGMRDVLMAGQHRRRVRPWFAARPPAGRRGPATTPAKRPADDPDPAETVDAGSPPGQPDHRRFWLHRHTDVSGVSGTGAVAEGVQFTDGSVALRWTSATPCTAVFDGVDQVQAVHGHAGSTQIRWLDPAAPDR